MPGVRFAPVSRAAACEEPIPARRVVLQDVRIISETAGENSGREYTPAPSCGRLDAVLSKKDPDHLRTVFGSSSAPLLAH
jgi:hypothetical protein